MTVGETETPAAVFASETPLARAWRIVRAVAGWIKEHWKLVTFCYVLLLFLLPSFYLLNVRIFLPKSNYKIGSLEAPDFTIIRKWNVTIGAVENRPRDQRLLGLMKSINQIARTEKDTDIPGRSGVGALEEENAGKTWGGGQCLFVNDITFMVIVPQQMDSRADDKNHPEFVALETLKPNDPLKKYMVVSASTINAEAAARHVQPDVYYRGILKRMGLEALTVVDTRVKDKPVSYPARVQIWASGAPAPCSIWPF